MMLWAILTVMTAAAAVLVSAPFFRNNVRRGADASAGLAVFRDQLRELDRETEEGLIDKDQADAARSEIMRRMLTAEAVSPTSGPDRSPASVNSAVIGIAGIVVLGSVGLYAMNGRPELPSASPGHGNQGGLLAALSAQGNSQIDDRDRGATSAGLASVDDMIDRLKLRLAVQPNDPDGWRMLGWSLFRTERYPEAVEAYAKAVTQLPQSAELLSSYGEAVVRSARGAVSSDAAGIFDKVLALDPKDPRARFFKGLAQEQNGNKAAALDAWLAILNGASPGEDWVADLEQRVAELAQEIGVDISDRARRAKGPAPADIANAQSLPLEQQDAMIRGMVSGLATRLEAAPNDEQGWIRLIRSYTVLDDKVAATKALRQALEIFGAASTERSRIVAAARELGIAP